ncbi:MAG: M23 family metallopeptidase [Phormidesmis sp.]
MAQNTTQNTTQNNTQSATANCPAALARMQSYSTAPGDTMASIAATYQLQPATLVRFNPGVGNSPAPGTSLLIPPFNGSVVSVAAGESWQSLADRTGSRADILFEVNGCVSDVPGRVFVPGAIAASVSRPETLQLPGYPLLAPADIAVSYGWQPHTVRDELVFNSGIAFEIPTQNEVLSVESGTVAFAGEREGYGRLVVINHAQGLQTRYANLSDIAVTVGQSVAAATKIGSVGSDAPTFLYFEVRSNSDSGWVAEDPGKYLPALELR